MRRTVLLFSTSIGILLASMSCPAQVQPDLGAGFRPYGSYDGGNLDSVNLENGNLIVHIPLPVSFPQRGKLGQKWGYTVNSVNWQNVCTVPSPGSTLVCNWKFPLGTDALVNNAGMGVGLDHSLDVVVHRIRTTDAAQDTSMTETVGGYKVVTPDGSSHLLYDISATRTSFQSVDGTGWRLALSSPDSFGVGTVGVLTDRRGSRYQLSTFNGPASRHSMHIFTGCDLIITFNEFARTQTVTDSNGNVINVNNGTTWEDTMGRRISLHGSRLRRLQQMRYRHPYHFSQRIIVSGIGKQLTSSPIAIHLFR